MQRIEPFSGYQTHSNGVCVDAEMLLQLEEAAVPGGADDSLVAVSLTHVLTMTPQCPHHVLTMSSPCHNPHYTMI